MRPPLAGGPPHPLCTRQSPILYRPRCLQLTLALMTYSINRGKVGICRSQRLPGLPAGREAVGRAPGAGVCPACCYRSPAGAAATAPWLSQASGKGLSSCLAAEITKASCRLVEGAWGQEGVRAAGARPPGAQRPHGWLPHQGGSLVPLLAVLTPQIKGLRTMTSTLLSRRFSFLL